MYKYLKHTYKLKVQNDIATLSNKGRPDQALNLYKSFVKTQENNNELNFCIQKMTVHLTNM